MDIAEYIQSLDPDAVSLVKMLANMGSILTVDQARETILKLGKHPNEDIGSSPLSISSEIDAFYPDVKEEEK